MPTRWRPSEAFVSESGALAVHAFDQPETLLGQGTIGCEIDADLPGIDTLLVAVGGGGLIGGLAAWFRGRVKIIAVEPELSPTLWRALAAGEPVDAETEGIAADSLAPKRVGKLMFPIAQAFVERVGPGLRRRHPRGASSRCGTRFAWWLSRGALPPLARCCRANTRRPRTSALRWWSAGPIRRRFGSTESDRPTPPRC